MTKKLDKTVTTNALSPATPGKKGFQKGNPGGPGNPYFKVMATFRGIMMGTIQKEDIVAITQMLVEKSKKGDLNAVKIVLPYALGAPKPITDEDERTIDIERLTAADKIAMIEKL